MFRKQFVLINIFLFFVFNNAAIAQPMLPDMAGSRDKGMNILSWTCQYEGIKSIAVQRSADSVYNYATIGYVKNLKKGVQAFIDGHPVPGNNWYRLYIAFNSDLTWYSNRVKLFVDSSAILQQGALPPNDSLQKLASRIRVDTSVTITTRTTIATPGKPADTIKKVVNTIQLSIPDPGEVDEYNYIKSQYVFTNPFTGHVTMEVPDVKKYHYSIRFFDMNNRKIMDIPHITESPIIIDKRNFQRKGLFKFELKKGKQKLEGGYITIY